MTPESALTVQFATFINRLKGTQQLDRIVIDECHVALNDQKNFRPKLRELWRLNGAAVQMVMLTATLPVSMEDKFWTRMRVEREQVSMFRMSTTRKNVRYRVHGMQARTQAESESELVELVRKNLRKYEPGKVIVYCNSVRKTKQLAEALDCDGYYRGAGEEEKKEMLKEFADCKSKSRVIVATSAFGMGIDVANIRVVVHADRPRTLLDYGQESGRAGRDGLRSEAIIVVNETGLDYGGEYDGEVNEMDRELVSRFIEAECQRVVLDGFFDGREDREGCEDGEEQCQGCNSEVEEGDEEEGEEIEEQNADQDNTKDTEEERQFQIHRSRVESIRMQGQRAEQEESVDAENLQRHLEKARGLCAVCTRKGKRNNVHSIYYCGEDDNAVQQYRSMKNGIRGGKVMERYGGCNWCFIPQAWCNRWEYREAERGWFVKTGEKKCKFMDVVLGGFVTWAEDVEYQKGLMERMGREGLDVKSQEQVLKYLGRERKWGGKQVWVLLVEYWEAVKANGRQE